MRITGLELYGQDVTKPYVVGDPTAATNALNDPTGQKQFTLTAGPDAGPTQVLMRTASSQAFLIIRYSL